MPTKILSSRVVRCVGGESMLIKLEEVATIPFSTRDPETGNAAAPTVGPTLSVYEEGATTPLVGTNIALVTLAATGQYAATVTCTAASGFEVGKTYIIRAAATFSTVSDEAPIGSFQVSVETHGEVIDKSIASVETNIVVVGDANWATATGFATPGDVPSVADIWNHTEGIAGTKDAFEIICIAAAGAGAGRLSIQGHTPGTTRDETFLYPDETTTAFVVTVDSEGARTNITFP